MKMVKVLKAQLNAWVQLESWCFSIVSKIYHVFSTFYLKKKTFELLEVYVNNSLKLIYTISLCMHLNQLPKLSFVWLTSAKTKNSNKILSKN